MLEFRGHVQPTYSRSSELLVEDLVCAHPAMPVELTHLPVKPHPIPSEGVASFRERHPAVGFGPASRKLRRIQRSADRLRDSVAIRMPSEQPCRCRGGSPRIAS